MRVVVQRVKKASCNVDGEITGSIAAGLLVFLGITEGDEQADIDWLAHKVANLRVFPDDDGAMNRSVQDVQSGILLISQFTLYGNLKKGTRPSFSRAARPDEAIPLYEAFIQALEKAIGYPVQTGRFGADMQIEAHNDGPVTLIIDSRERSF